MGRATRTAAVAALMTCAGLTGGIAHAGEVEDGGLLRLAHLSPDTPAVDVYVDSVADPDAGITLSGVGYGTVSDYQDVPPGEYTVSMREAGAGEDAPAVLSTTVEIGTGSARTVAGVGLFDDLGLEIIEDALETPPDGEARVRVLAGAATADSLDVALADGTEVAAGLAFASTGDYVDVPAGQVTLSVSADDGDAAEVPVELAAGSVYSLLVLDDDQGLTVQPVLDAASPEVVPQGGVEAGAGGAAREIADVAVVAAFAVSAAAGALLLRMTTRRSGHAARRG
jgi:hypothetical protein